MGEGYRLVALSSSWTSVTDAHALKTWKDLH